MTVGLGSSPVSARSTTDALTPIERRLREGRYRVMRGIVENAGEATPGYAAKMSEVLERSDGAVVATSAAATAGATATAPPTAAGAPAGSANAAGATANYATSGLVRLDMVTVGGATAVPEPATSGAILGALALAVVMLRRGRSEKTQADRKRDDREQRTEEDRA